MGLELPTEFEAVTIDDAAKIFVDALREASHRDFSCTSNQDGTWRIIVWDGTTEPSVAAETAHELQCAEQGAQA